MAISEISEYTNAVVIGSHIVKIIENAYIKKHVNRDKIVEDINIEVKNLSLGIK